MSEKEKKKELPSYACLLENAPGKANREDYTSLDAHAGNDHAEGGGKTVS